MRAPGNGRRGRATHLENAQEIEGAHLLSKDPGKLERIEESRKTASTRQETDPLGEISPFFVLIGKEHHLVEDFAVPSKIEEKPVLLSRPPHGLETSALFENDSQLHGLSIPAS
jgi:hypothetical protein